MCFQEKILLYLPSVWPDKFCIEIWVSYSYYNWNCELEKYAKVALQDDSQKKKIKTVKFILQKLLLLWF
jgi:hypothetical protein